MGKQIFRIFFVIGFIFVGIFPIEGKPDEKGSIVFADFLFR
jgi:hypothetical protein